MSEVTGPENHAEIINPNDYYVENVYSGNVASLNFFANSENTKQYAIPKVVTIFEEGGVASHYDLTESGAMVFQYAENFDIVPDTAIHDVNTPKKVLSGRGINLAQAQVVGSTLGIGAIIHSGVVLKYSDIGQYVTIGKDAYAEHAVITSTSPKTGPATVIGEASRVSYSSVTDSVIGAKNEISKVSWLTNVVTHSGVRVTGSIIGTAIQKAKAFAHSSEGLEVFLAQDVVVEDTRMSWGVDVDRETRIVHARMDSQIEIGSSAAIIGESSERPVSINHKAIIGADSQIMGSSRVGEGAHLGRSTKLRNTEIEEGVHLGEGNNFVGSIIRAYAKIGRGQWYGPSPQERTIEVVGNAVIGDKVTWPTYAVLVGHCVLEDRVVVKVPEIQHDVHALNGAVIDNPKHKQNTLVVPPEYAVGLRRKTHLRRRKSKSRDQF